MNKLFCLVGVLAFAVCIQCGPSEETKKMMDECAAEVGLTDHPRGPPDFSDQKVKCLHACLMKKSGKFVDGKVNVESVLERLAKNMPNIDDTVKTKITECVNTANQESDECEVAGAMGKCFVEKIQRPRVL